jgi:hypothetical protein
MNKQRYTETTGLRHLRNPVANVYIGIGRNPTRGWRKLQNEELHNLYSSPNTRAIRKVTSGDLLTKQAMRSKCYYVQKNTYIFKLLLYIVTAGIEALVISGNTFLYAFVKEACVLSHILTPSINSSLLLKPYNPNQSFR